MSAILGVFGDALPDDEALRRMRAAAPARGDDRVDVWRGEGAVLCVGRHEWECATHLAGERLIADGGDVVVAADASIYFRHELVRRLDAAGVRAPADAPAAELVLAAYRAWGADAARALDGDFAFIIWDRRARTVTGARDLAGKRPLHFAALDGGRTLVVASLASSVVEHPRVWRRLDPVVLAETIAQFWQSGDETCWVGVRELLAARTLAWSPGQEPRVDRHWNPPAFGTARGSFEDGAAELRELLIAAAAERMAPEGAGATAVWLSGGWDSPSVFASGSEARRRGIVRGALRPVSISYPEGDPGREDELIASIASHWNVPVHWIDVDSIPLLGDAAAGAVGRDLPFAHTYEHWNGALAAASRAVGARVAFDGNGGDQLFQISNVYLADLLRGGRWRTLAREWREKGLRGGSGTFAQFAMLPALPLELREAIQDARGRERADYLERPIPGWIRRDFARQHDLRGRERSRMPARAERSSWKREAEFYLTAPALPRAFAALSGFALREGVELRSPLYDRRIVEFACARPREERSRGRETKRLLRQAMQGILPDDVLAPRTHRTGITSAYSDRRMRTEFPLFLEEALREPLLAELGIVDPAELRRGWIRFLETGANSLKIPLFLTLQVELWLRARRPTDSRRSAAMPPTAEIAPDVTLTSHVAG